MTAKIVSANFVQQTLAAFRLEPQPHPVAVYFRPSSLITLIVFWLIGSV